MRAVFTVVRIAPERQAKATMMIKKLVKIKVVITVVVVIEVVVVVIFIVLISKTIKMILHLTENTH